MSVEVGAVRAGGELAPAVQRGSVGWGVTVEDETRCSGERATGIAAGRWRA